MPLPVFGFQANIMRGECQETPQQKEVDHVIQTGIAMQLVLVLRCTRAEGRGLICGRLKGLREEIGLVFGVCRRG